MCSNADMPPAGALPSLPNFTGMADLAYSVILEPDDGAYSVIVPALPEVHTFGETPEEAMNAAREAIELSLEYRRERGEEIPPSDADQTQLVTIRIPAA
jgi:antitoxin HicB